MELKFLRFLFLNKIISSSLIAFTGKKNFVINLFIMNLLNNIQNKKKKIYYLIVSIKDDS